MKLYDLLKLLKETQTIDILCEALIVLIKETASQVRTLEKIYRDSLDCGSELEEKREMLQERQRILSGFLKHTSGFFKECLLREDFELMGMEMPEYLFEIKTLEAEDDEDGEDEEDEEGSAGADIIDLDFFRNRRE
ncbi:hypothetical protein KJ885_02800 [Patescibacteria group bacterium]|nr:hypothetical protein [Patescibacteria group bacterium]